MTDSTGQSAADHEGGLSLKALDVARTVALNANSSAVLRAAYDAIPPEKRRPHRWRDQRRLFYRACLSKYAILSRTEDTLANLREQEKPRPCANRNRGNNT